MTLLACLVVLAACSCGLSASEEGVWRRVDSTGYRRMQRNGNATQTPMLLVSPISGQVVGIWRGPPQSSAPTHTVAQALASNFARAYQRTEQLGGLNDDCRAILANVDIERQVPYYSELMQQQLVATQQRQVQLRTCRGRVPLNKCEGQCASFAQPSVNARGGLYKQCSCCNEGSFRRIVVRLGECYAANGERIMPPEEGHFLDVTIDEPIECKCRKCDADNTS